ncbi:MAG: nitroreductase family protein [Deltaproteobacteria bacterium]|nr:nitroreductase family protein [Deltaproteobacteria bacterium]
MTLFAVDTKKCRRDGLCVAECPGLLIELIGEEGFPTPIPEAETLCINCGHCVAVCPQGAISLKTMAPKDCLPLRKELNLSPEQAEQFLRSRRSIRCYKEKPVPRDLLNRVIETAGYGPTGGNLQPVRWLVIEETKEVRRLTGLVADWQRSQIQEETDSITKARMERIVKAWDQGIDRICRNAPHLIIAHGLSALPASQSSCAIALTYLELAALSLGLGTCWAGYFNTAANSYPPLLKALALPRGHLPYGAMMIGYPKYSYRRIPLRNKPKITWR